MLVYVFEEKILPKILAIWTQNIPTHFVIASFHPKCARKSANYRDNNIGSLRVSQ
jgi:hypothetical protein